MVREIETGLEALQSAVGGLIEAVYPFEEPVAIVCNEEGKLMGLPLNRALLDENGKVYDILAASKKALLAVSDGEHRNCHPLSPSVRKYFELVPYDVKGGKQE